MGMKWSNMIFAFLASVVMVAIYTFNYHGPAWAGFILLALTYWVVYFGTVLEDYIDDE